MSAETWRPVVGYVGYEISDCGNVRSYRNHAGTLDDRPHPLETSFDRKGYRVVCLTHNGKRNTERVHRLVGEAFIGPRPRGLVTRHLDGNRLNNTVENLKYGTYLENHQDSVLHGTCWAANVTHCPQGHAYSESNTYRTPSGRRNCRACGREASRRYYARAKQGAA